LDTTTITKCLKCGYERTKKDDEFISKEECPKCGVVYAKLTDKQMQSPEKEEKTIVEIQKDAKKKIKISHYVAISALLLIVALVAFHFYQKTPKTNIYKSLPELAKVISLSVVTIYVESEKGGRTGSGFFHAKNIVVTNHHVIQGAKDAKIKTSDGAYFNIKCVRANDPEHDIALLEIEGNPRDIKPLTVSKTIPEQGETIMAFGSPTGLDNTMSQGIVSNIREYSGTKWIQFTAAISPGSSGGPIVNMKGEVVGIVTFVRPWAASQTSLPTPTQNLNLGIAGEHLTNLKPQACSPLSEITIDAARDEQRTKEDNDKRDNELARVRAHAEWNKMLSDILAPYNKAIFKPDTSYKECYDIINSNMNNKQEFNSRDDNGKRLAVNWMINQIIADRYIKLAAIKVKFRQCLTEARSQEEYLFWSQQIGSIEDIIQSYDRFVQMRKNPQ
jgi:Zn ribbon nucleic-acid-binding protein